MVIRPRYVHVCLKQLWRRIIGKGFGYDPPLNQMMCRLENSSLLYLLMHRSQQGEVEVGRELPCT